MINIAVAAVEGEHPREIRRGKINSGVAVEGSPRPSCSPYLYPRALLNRDPIKTRPVTCVSELFRHRARTRNQNRN